MQDAPSKRPSPAQSIGAAVPFYLGPRPFLHVLFYMDLDPAILIRQVLVPTP